MDKNRNVQKLTWFVSSVFKHGDDHAAAEFAPTFVPKDNLTHLDLLAANSSILRKFIVCHPNLRHFSVTVCDSEGAQGALEEFFKHFSALEECKIHTFSGYPEFDFFRSKSFWRLNLKKLKMFSGENLRINYSDEFLTKVAASFANLEQFIAYGLVVTNRGVGKLAKLKKFRDLVLKESDDLDQSILRLAENGLLRRFYLSDAISPLAFVSLVTKCTELRYLGVYGIEGVETSEVAAEILRSLIPHCNGEKRRLIFYPYPAWFCSEWNPQLIDVWFSSDEVKAVLKELRDEMKFDIRLVSHFLCDL